MTNKEWFENHYAPVKGGVIKEVLVDIDEEEHNAYIGLLIDINGELYTLWCLRDEEGNGAGYLELMKA